MKWTRELIIEEIRDRNSKGLALAYNAASVACQSLVSAGAYHFGSWRKAIESAGLRYADINQRPKWSKEKITSGILKALDEGQELSWSSITDESSKHRKVAFAALNHFASWGEALASAGICVEEVRKYQFWSKESVSRALSLRNSLGEPMNSKAVFDSQLRLHAAAHRIFGSYENALVSIGLDPESIRLKTSWSKESVLACMKEYLAAGIPLKYKTMLRVDSSLLGAAVRHFGSFRIAQTALGLSLPERPVNPTAYERRLLKAQRKLAVRARTRFVWTLEAIRENSVVDDESGCWMWAKSVGLSGYSEIAGDYGHRLVYSLVHGSADGVVRHKCDRPGCVNPDHLELGTPADNARDRDERGRYNFNRLTEAQVRRIRAECKVLKDVPPLAKELGFNPTTIYRAWKGKTYATVAA